jgi:hypothetical protein
MYRQLDFLASQIIFKSLLVGQSVRHFCEKRGADGVFLMANLWWNAGGRWWESDVNFDRQKLATFLDLFFGFPVLGTDQ